MSIFCPLFVCVAAAAEYLQGVRAVEIPPPAPVEPGGSAIDRPEFKIRNLPYTVEESKNIHVESAGEEMPPAVSQAAPEEILSSVPDNLILQYLDHTDFENHLTTQQTAEKYLGASLAAPESADTTDLSLVWLMMSDMEQRGVKLNWFRNARSGISIEDFNRVVDIRPYRMITALNSAAPPDLREVRPVIKVTYFEIEKLKMPGIKPLEDWDRHPNAIVVSPKIRPIDVGPITGAAARPITIETLIEAPQRMEPEEKAPSHEPPIPTQFGIPSSLRNGP